MSSGSCSNPTQKAKATETVPLPRIPGHYEAAVANTIVDGLLSRKFGARAGKRPPGRDSWRTKETAKRKTARARRSARATAGCISGSGKPARCPRRATKPAPSRNAVSIAMALRACATNISRPSTASLPKQRQPLRPQQHRRKLRLPDTAIASASRSWSRGQSEKVKSDFRWLI